MSRLISPSTTRNRTIVSKRWPQIDAWPCLNAGVQGHLKEINARASIQGNTVLFLGQSYTRATTGELLPKTCIIIDF